MHLRLDVGLLESFFRVTSYVYSLSIAQWRKIGEACLLVGSVKDQTTCGLTLDRSVAALAGLCHGEFGATAAESGLQAL